MISNFIHSTLVMTTPILLAALGGLFTDLSGMLNIGFEGMMLASAFTSIFVANATSSLLIGILAGLCSSTILAVIMVYFSLNLRANIFILGLATNLFADGLTVFLGVSLCKSKGTLLFLNAPRLSNIQIPFVHNIPYLGTMLSGYNALDYSAIILTIMSYLLIFYTPYGYHLRAVGKDSRVATSVGISVYKHRFLAFVWSGLSAGLAGAALSLPLQTFVGGMTSGRGWIALVAVVLGQGNPIGVLMASLLFGASSAFSNTLQALTDISPKLLLAIPFVITLIAMILHAIASKNTYEQL